jgi:hypothetical protein
MIKYVVDNVAQQLRILKEVKASPECRQLQSSSEFLKPIKEHSMPLPRLCCVQEWLHVPKEQGCLQATHQMELAGFGEAKPATLNYIRVLDREAPY